MGAYEYYLEWKKAGCAADPDIEKELAELDPEGCPEDERQARLASIEDGFGRDISFGTAGLRGVMKAGSAYMNVYTVGRASQALAFYIRGRRNTCRMRVALCYDSRHKSKLFAEVAARVFASNGIDVAIFDRIMPTPCLSFAVRELRCDAGVMITASHNSSEYNGYKVFGPDGCQITSAAAGEIFYYSKHIPIPSGIRMAGGPAGILPSGGAGGEPGDHPADGRGTVRYIGECVISDYLKNVSAQLKPLMLPGVSGEEVMKYRSGLSVVYTPLHGVGLEAVTSALRENGFTDVACVPSQSMPDGDFPTCRNPNPEDVTSLRPGIEYASERGADLLIATDPDCDRAGIAVRRRDGSYLPLTGNQTGLLLADWICSRREKAGTMPEDPVIITTVVSSGLAEKAASAHGAGVVRVLTGFKYIGEQIGMLEARGTEKSFLLGFEESYGYLAGTYVRDKDGVVASLLICEMAASFKKEGKDLAGVLDALYEKYGYCLETQHSKMFEGTGGKARMSAITDSFRTDPPRELAGVPVSAVLDYLPGICGLPQSDVLKFMMSDGSWIVLRPSGTEPKIKIYLSVTAASAKEAEEKEKRFAEAVDSRM
ncbi:MAG: phospho-sugar mutase [Clostridia bacterium]|nr:phospho-sugar mutase [Clostridia bacterium]